jgi:hypothetical protein
MLLAKNNRNCHLIRYEDLVEKEDRVLRTIAEVAQVTYPQVMDVLSHKVGSMSQGISDEERNFIEGRCGNIMQLFDYH